MKLTCLRTWIVAVLPAFLVLSAFGDTNDTGYPSRPISFVVPVGAGGLTDNITRLFAQRLSQRVGQPVVVDNKPGGGGIVAMQSVAKARGDGYTLILVFPGAAVVNPVLYSPAPYVTLRDFTPIVRLAMYPMVLISKPSFTGTAADLVAQALARPRGLNYGSAGPTTTSHLAMELFKRQVGADIVHIPFKGEAQALSELMAERLDVQFQTLSTALPQIRAGKVRALGLATSQRSKLAPEIPTLAEAGIRGLAIPGWYGVLAPAATPPAVVQRLNREFVAMLNEPEMTNRLEGLGVDGWSSTPEELGKWISEETERWRKVITEAGIKPE